ncbi:hypothetical protein [Herpetosiphon llansteffanensis]|uniref:hypothetical protein n=1 Tax=Herpetosiphon llansteffanensis TaxID=2094568 RepID=UPI000D7BED17|nr:hypothetical protein [Herpetosiphon llansteffanensis]
MVKPAEEPEDYADYIADLGRNLDASQRQQLADQWTAIGLSYSLESYAGRSSYELALFWRLAVAIALEVEGWLIVSVNQAFELPIGIYAAQQVAV